MLTASHNGEVCKAVSLGPLIKKFCINVPEHDLLFVATQVARAAGLKDPAGAANAHRSKGLRGLSLERLMAFEAMSLPKEPNGCSGGACCWAEATGELCLCISTGT